MEPIILELEREQNDLLIIAHESVLRVLYGYLMACNASDIPSLEFPRNEIIEVSITVPNSKPLTLTRMPLLQIIPASYNNEAKRIFIPNLPEETVPDSPEDIKIPVPHSGAMSPMPGGIGTPKEPVVEAAKSEPDPLLPEPALMP